MSEQTKNGQLYDSQTSESIDSTMMTSGKRANSTRPLGLAAKCAGAFALVAALVSLGLTTPIDVWVVSQMTTLTSSAGLLAVANLMSGLASVPCLAVAIFVSSFLLGKSRSQRLTIFAVQVANLLGAGALNVILKSIFTRPRPEMALVAETGWSFPSGHSMVAMAEYGLLIVLVIKFASRPQFAAQPHPASRHQPTSRARSASRPQFASKPVIVLLVAAIVLVGTSRVLLGVHYPTDVLGGFLASAAWALLVDDLLLEARKTQKSPANQRTIAGAANTSRSDRSFGRHVPSQLRSDRSFGRRVPSQSF